jgi:DNA-binding Xre family transcriptional regulator
MLDTKLVQSLRILCGYTQEELAYVTKLSLSSITKIETRPGTNIRLSTLNKLAEALQCTPQELLIPVPPKAHSQIIKSIRGQ